MTRRATLPILAAIALAYVAWRRLREPERLPAFEPAPDEQGGFGVGPGYRTLFERTAA